MFIRLRRTGSTLCAWKNLLLREMGMEKVFVEEENFVESTMYNVLPFMMCAEELFLCTVLPYFYNNHNCIICYLSCIDYQAFSCKMDFKEYELCDFINGYNQLDTIIYINPKYL